MDIWQEIGADGESGARRLVSEYGDRLYAAASLLCLDDHDAEELVFRTFSQAVRKIGLYSPTGDFFSWLYAIMLNFRRMDLRRKRPAVVPVGTSVDLPEEPVAGDVPEDVAAALDRTDVREALGRISEPLREVVVLHYFDGLSLDEIAAMLSIPCGTVKSRLFNARRELHSILAEGRKE